MHSSNHTEHNTNNQITQKNNVNSHLLKENEVHKYVNNK